MDDKDIYLNEDNAIFIEGLCKYYKTADLSFWLDDVKDLPIYLFENGFMEEKFVEKYRNSYSNYKAVLNQLNSIEGYDYYYVVIFAIFMAYIHNQNNFDNFSAIVDDVLSVKINGPHYLNSINAIVRCTNYKEMPNVRRLMKAMLTGYTHLLYLLSPCRELNNSFLAIYNQMIGDYNMLREEQRDTAVFSKILDFRVGELFEKYDCDTIYISRKEIVKIDKYYYNKILLSGDRYFYFNEKLKEVEDSIYFRKNIYSYLDYFNFELFEELNEGSERDSFITCMDIVFDSDSYTELLNKLSSLVEACKSYENGDREKAFEIIKNLNSDSLKEVYGGELVSYPTNCMNKIEKPKKIVDRMKELYSKIDSSLSYDFIDKYHWEYMDISSMIDSISSNIGYEKRVSTRFKKKMKEIFSRNKG